MTGHRPWASIRHKTDHSLPISRNTADRAKNGGGGNRTRERVPAESRRTQGFSASIFLGEVELFVYDDALNVYITDGNDFTVFWQSESLDQAIPKLEAILKAARLAQEATYGRA